MTSNFTYFLAQIAIVLPAFLAAISIHEFAHAFVAHLCGDDTAKRYGRLTLNPIAHIDPLGLFCLIFLRFGWAKSVQIDNRNFKYPKFYSVLVAIAGPMSNFLLALVSFYVFAYFPTNYFSAALTLSIQQIIIGIADVNVMLGVFNLLPIPPLDGSHLITTFLVDRYPNFVFWLYRYSFFILLLLLFLPQTKYMLIKLILMMEVFLKQLVI